VLKNQTGKRFANQGASSGKSRYRDFSRLRSALRRADLQLTRAMKEFRDTLKDFEDSTDFIGIEKSALDEITDLFDAVRSHCEEDPNRPFAGEIIGFANAAEEEMYRFVTERSLLCQEIVDALETAQVEADNEAGS
jgi:hypothetical protein